MLRRSISKEDFSYVLVNEVKDWGATTTKLIVSINETIDKHSVTADTFRVSVSRSDPRLGANALIEEGKREVINAYVSDKDGEPVERGRFVTLEMKIAPDLSLCSAMNYTDDRNVWIKCSYTISQVNDINSDYGIITGLVIDSCTGEKRVGIDKFNFKKGNYDNYEMGYAYFSPNTDGCKKPLIIWLHGLGEGGTDPTVPLAANKVVNYASDEIQEVFGGAYVLVPQAPTRWMDGISGDIDGTSIYEKALWLLINDYVSSNENIDKNRIYIGGCSNGAYMTELMIKDHQDYFAAAFLVCGLICDSKYKDITTDEEIDSIIKTPTWWTVSSTDNLFAESVPPHYERLIKAGAKDTVLKVFDNVVDTSGLYNKEDGTPYEYQGHYSWIYVHNNEVTLEIDGSEITIMEWLASHSL